MVGADLHELLAERAGEELVEIRAYHLDQAALLLAELDGEAPAELRRDAAVALETAGKRALGREANRSARKLFLRAVELEPTLKRRHQAARAASRLGDVAAVAREMERVRVEAHEQGDAMIEGRALTALAEVAMHREGDPEATGALAEQALAVLPEDDAEGRFYALMRLSDSAWFPGDAAGGERYAESAVEVARVAGRKDLEIDGLTRLAWLAGIQLELDRAESLVEREVELAAESGSVVARAKAQNSLAALRRLQGDRPAARAAFEEARRLYEETGIEKGAAWTLVFLGWIEWADGELERAEQCFREAGKRLAAVEDYSSLCEAKRGLAEVVLAQGKLEEAERLALEARELVAPSDVSSIPTTTMTLGLVRAAQGRDEEAEALLREAVAGYEGTAFLALKPDPLAQLARFLRERGRDEEADDVEAEIPPLPGGWLGRWDAAGLTSRADASPAEIA